MTERETEVGSTLRFISFHFCLHVVFKQTLPKTNRSFHHVSFCAEFLLRDTGKCSVLAQRRTIGKVSDPITTVMAVRHFVSRSRLIAPKSLATV